MNQNREEERAQPETETAWVRLKNERIGQLKARPEQLAAECKATGEKTSVPQLDAASAEQAPAIARLQKVDANHTA